MKAASIPLGQYVGDKIFYGIKTGFNEAFIIDQRTRDRLIAEDPKSEEIIKPFAVGEDVKRYRIDYKKRYLILTRIGVPIDRYPAIFAHLKQYQEQLEKRWDKGHHWWELRACDYYEEFEKPKIMWPVIAISNKFALIEPGNYSNDKTFFTPTNDLYLLAMLNSSTTFLYLSSQLSFLRGGFLEYRAQTLVHTPIRSITFSTPAEERTSLTNEGVGLYKVNKHEELLSYVEACLAHQPEQSDVIHDMLVYLSQQMIDLNGQRAQALENFLLALESVLPDSDMQRLGRLWTPPNVAQTAQTGDQEAEKRSAEAQEKLGTLATRQLDLRDDIGFLNEEQWRWLLKRRLARPDLVELTKVFRLRQPAISALDNHIAMTDRLIDQVVYRLYGLSKEEIATVEMRAR